MTETGRSTTGKVLLVLFRVLFTFFALYTTYYIFRNSMEIASVSSAHSGRVLQVVNQFLDRLHLHPLTTAQVRKLAHFGEYTVLGFWFMLCLRVYTKHYLRHISWPLLLGLLIANTDEWIQLHVSGRSSSVRDVWIDFGGVCSGVMLTLVLLLILSGIWYLLGFGRESGED